MFETLKLPNPDKAKGCVQSPVVFIYPTDKTIRAVLMSRVWTPDAKRIWDCNKKLFTFQQELLVWGISVEKCSISFLVEGRLSHQGRSLVRRPEELLFQLNKFYLLPRRTGAVSRLIVAELKPLRCQATLSPEWVR